METPFHSIAERGVTGSSEIRKRRDGGGRVILVFLGDTPKSTYRTCAHHIRTRERRRGSRPAVALLVEWLH